jgi:hypothetical protein
MKSFKQTVLLLIVFSQRIKEAVTLGATYLRWAVLHLVIMKLIVEVLAYQLLNYLEIKVVHQEMAARLREIHLELDLTLMDFK